MTDLPISQGRPTGPSVSLFLRHKNNQLIRATTCATRVPPFLCLRRHYALENRSKHPSQTRDADGPHLCRVGIRRPANASISARLFMEGGPHRPTSIKCSPSGISTQTSAPPGRLSRAISITGSISVPAAVPAKSLRDYSLFELGEIALFCESTRFSFRCV
jgi:hypothetical protein